MEGGALSRASDTDSMLVLFVPSRKSIYPFLNTVCVVEFLAEENANEMVWCATHTQSRLVNYHVLQRDGERECVYIAVSGRGE